jgi:hypothetical protein
MLRVQVYIDLSSKQHSVDVPLNLFRFLSDWASWGCALASSCFISLPIGDF